MSRAGWVCILGVLCATVAWADDGIEKMVVKGGSGWHDQVEAMITSGDFKGAKTLVKKKKRGTKGARRDACVSLLKRIDGEKAWGKLTKTLGKKKYRARPLASLATLQKFRSKYTGVEALVARCDERIEELRQTLYTSVDDFEGDELPSGLTAVMDETKHGARAARFGIDGGKGVSVILDVPQSDLTEFGALVLWVYADKKGGRITFDAVTGKYDFFEAWCIIDWVGWKEIRIPLQGRGSKFSRKGAANWENISALRFWKPTGTSIDIVVDDIRLENLPSR